MITAFTGSKFCIQVHICIWGLNPCQHPIFVQPFHLSNFNYHFYPCVWMDQTKKKTIQKLNPAITKPQPKNLRFADVKPQSIQMTLLQTNVIQRHHAWDRSQLKSCLHLQDIFVIYTWFQLITKILYLQMGLTVTQSYCYFDPPTHWQG